MAVAIIATHSAQLFSGGALNHVCSNSLEEPD